MQAKYEDVKRKLKREGYTNIVLIENKPNSRTKPHFHLKELKIVILRGTLRMVIGNTTKVYSPGDIAIVPKRTKHYGIAGKNGVDTVEGIR